jgi:predicted DNA binding protein/DNA-binding NarL/FixJ family response regulator
MSGNALDILLVEDNPGDARLIEEMLQDAGTLLERVELDTPSVENLRIHAERSLDAGIERLDETNIDVVLLDLNLPGSRGMETLRAMTEAAGPVAVIVLTGLRDEQMGIETIQAGAQDYLVKDEVTSDLLVRSIHHAIERNRQEHRRQRRREQLEALNRLTRELMEAETPAAVSEHVVEAAEERFDLPVVSLALFDDAEGGLRPVDATSDASALVDFDALLRVGEGAGWRAFAENEPPHVTEAGAPSLTELALFPLGSHGLLIAGSTEPEGVSAADFDFVGTVAGNVEAALDRVERAQERQERERLLEEQNRTLERLNDINDIIRSISRALVQASTREEVESVVCEQLAEGGPYELAWIGEHEHASDSVVPRECAGTDVADGVAALSTPDSPAERAITTREPQVVNNVLENRAMEGWRRSALDRGYHAVASLPLVYEDAMYGSLNVYAAKTDVFGELERTVLSELADTIAYAINGAESRKALLGQEVTALEFSVADTEAGFVALAREHDCTLTAENFVPRSDGGVRRFMTTRGVDAGDVLGFSSRLPVRDLTLVSEYEEEGEPVCLFRMDLSADSIEETVLEHGGRPRELRVAEGEATVVVELAADAAVREFVDLFENRFAGAELVAQRSQQRSRQSPAEQRASLTEVLTDRQLEALQTAYFSGFFDRPRRHTGSEVAESMGISQPTFSHHLREAHRRLCESLFGRETPGNAPPQVTD